MNHMGSKGAAEILRCVTRAPTSSGRKDKPRATPLRMTSLTPALAVVAAVAALAALAVAAQQHVPQWQITAGGTARFEVASVKQNTSGKAAPNVAAENRAGHTNITMGPENDYTDTGGLFSAANYPLLDYMMFAFKLNDYQRKLLLSGATKAILNEHFDIEAHAAQRNSSKDQMRLMMQSLLAERFKLTTHFETRQLPVLAMMLVNAQKTGPELKAHSDALPCEKRSGPAAVTSGGTPATTGPVPACEAIIGELVSGQVRLNSRGVPMEIFADNLLSIGDFDRVVIDRTGLSGSFDLSLNYTPEGSPDLPLPQGFQPDASGPPLLDALKEQLGLKLVRTNGPVDVLVIDHLEELAAN